MANSIVWTLEEILYKYRNGDYKTKLDYAATRKCKDNHIFDEDKSVKWNQEQVAIKNAKIDKLKAEYNQDDRMLQKQLRDNVTSSLVNNYGFNPKQAQKIEEKVYSNYHSDMLDYFFYLEDMVDFITEINELK